MPRVTGLSEQLRSVPVGGVDGLFLSGQRRVGQQLADGQLVQSLVYGNGSYSGGYPGIRLADAQRWEVENNTVYGNRSEALWIEANCADLTIRNNVLWQSGGGYALRLNGNPLRVSSDYNDLYATGGGNVGYWNGAVYGNLAQWRVARGDDLHSLSEDPRFVDVDGFDNLLGGDNFRDDDFT